MTTQSENLKKSILAALRAVREHSNGRVTRTALFKLVYLLDCFHAESNSGQISTGIKWYFHHYGPYNVELANSIDQLSKIGLIQCQQAESKDIEFCHYWLDEYPVGPSLSEVGLSASQSLRFSKLVKDYSNDLSKMLNHVYFNTLPMRHAVPGREIDFSIYRDSVDAHTLKHTHIHDQSRIFRILELCNNLKSSNTSNYLRSISAHNAIYDSTYINAMNTFDSDADEQVDITFRAQLN